MLRRATMADRTIILTMVDESWASPGSVLDILLQSFKSGEGTQRLLKHLVIITMDPKAFEYCMSLHPHCIPPSISPYYYKRQSFTSPDHNTFSWTRNDILHDGGIFFMKANAISFEFLKYWKLTKFLYPNSRAVESMCITMMERQDMVDEYSVRVQDVNTTSFGGFCQLNKDMLKEAYTIHANCCDDLTSKVHDMRIALNDWIHFRKGDNASEALRWPQKCFR